jgi:Mechanosensitive ion channel, conserved TM helix
MCYGVEIKLSPDKSGLGHIGPEGQGAVNETLQNILNSLGSWSLKVLGFLAILIVGWIISRLIGRVVDRLLGRVGFNRLAERTQMRRWTGSYEPSALVGRVAYYAALLFTFQIAFNVFGPNPVSTLISTIISWLPRLLVAAVIVVVAVAIAGAIYDIVHNALSQFPYGGALGRAAQVVVVALGVIAALSQIGIAVSVTLPVLIAVLATIGGILVVGVGGGLIQPMRERLERALNRAESEGAKMAEQRRSQRPAEATMKERGDRMAQPGYAGASADRDVKAASDLAAEKARAGQAQGQARTGQAQSQAHSDQSGRAH